MNDLKNIIRQALDIHMHIGPEPIPRKYTTQQLINEEKGKISGFVLKNHFYPSSPFIKEIKKAEGIKLYGGIVLNNSVGGLNSEAVYLASLLTTSPIMVWLPTINAANFLAKSKYEIVPEWVNNKNFKARSAKDIKPVEVTKKGRLTNKAISLLKSIKKCNAALATGHIAWQETVLVVEKALLLGITKIVITHPIYQKIDMPIEIQQELAKKGCFIEVSYSMYSIDKIPLVQLIDQIKKIGSKGVIISSDVGQTFSPSPSQALEIFAKLLLKKGIDYAQLYQMMVENPRKLLTSSHLK